MKVVCILFSSLAFEEEKDRSPFLSKKLNVSNGDVFSAYLPRTWSSRQICIYWPTWERLFDILTSLVDSSHYKYFFSFIFIFHHQRCLRVSLHFYSLIFFPPLLLLLSSSCFYSQSLQHEMKVRFPTFSCFPGHINI